MQPVRRSPWYRSLPFVIVLLVCCWPAGILLMWLGAPWSRRTKTIITAIVVPLGLLVTALSQRGQPSSVSVPPTTAPIVALTQAPTTAPTTAPTLAPTLAPPTIAQPTEPPEPTQPAPQPTPAEKPVAPAPPPTSAPKPVAPTAAPKPSAPPAYDWVSLSQTSTTNRPRFKADVVVPADYGNEQVQAVLASAVERAFREQRTAKAVVVFAYSSRAEVNKGADKGKAQASSDRLGWSGDGKFDTFSDEGKIYMTIGNLVGFGDRQDIAVDRGQPATAPAAPPAPTAAPKPAPAAKPAGGTTCGSYPSQAAAQAAYRANPSGLRSMDSDDDGIACEGNPPPRDNNPVRR